MIDEKEKQDGMKACFDHRVDDKVERELMRDPLIAYTRAFDDAIDWFKKALWHDVSEMPEKGKAFIFLAALWHDASVKPEEGEQILYTDTEGGEIVDVNVTTTDLYDFMPWNEVVRFFNISKWCYIDDLLPKGGDV